MSLSRSCANAASIAAAAWLLIGWATGASRAADAANGKLIIVKALYGDLSEDNATDVTQKVAAMVKDNSLNVIASKATLGDAPGGAGKQLKVSYTFDGVYRTKTVKEDETLDISTRLFIRKALYGDLQGGRTTDVTEQVADAIRSNRLSLKATNDAFGGDPANGVVKKLRVDYTFDGVDGSRTVMENQTLTLPGKGE